MAFCLSWGAFKTVASVVSLNLNLQTMEVQLVREKSLLLLPSSTDPLWSAHLFEHPGGNTQHKSHAIGIAKSSSNIFDHLGIRLVSSFLDFGAALLISSTAFASFCTFALHLLYSKLLFHLDCSTYDIYIYIWIYMIIHGANATLLVDLFTWCEPPPPSCNPLLIINPWPRSTKWLRPKDPWMDLLAKGPRGVTVVTGNTGLQHCPQISYWGGQHDVNMTALPLDKTSILEVYRFRDTICPTNKNTILGWKSCEILEIY